MVIMHNNSSVLDAGNKEESSGRSNEEEIEDIEWSPDQEILLLYSLHGLKPVGPHKHFRMIQIHDRLANAMNKNVPPPSIWRKLNSWYDMEALDEAEAEADAANSVEIDFALPSDEYSEMIELKLRGLSLQTKANLDSQLDTAEMELQKDTLMESDASSQDQKLTLSDEESSKESDTSKGMITPKNSGKEPLKRGVKRTLTPIKDSVSQKSSFKDSGKKDMSKKEDLKKGTVKETKPRKDSESEDGNKLNKKDSSSKKSPEQSIKEVEVKKPDQKKNIDTPKNQKENAKQQRADSAKRGDAKITRSETPKQKNELKKELNSDKKKEVEKKVERKSPEKTPDSGRAGKLRGRKETETLISGTKRTKEMVSKSTESVTEEPPKKVKTPAAKGRPTRNSMEPPKSASPAPSPVKRRTRVT